ncbi:DUF1566 domain-containing protein [Rhodoferax sp.]|uniref:Lcl C-terminal domain-containing protein n=1 Tax=Rhodoferax sp. TaxID=50421 RepID=UPI0026ABCBCB|nr:DUF1566 domain-containing protein [Rhodoferax sp.]MDO8319768.1 DUF1566 domain-containing protein [Rhodoferax sp.]MDP2679202.1 DUF1566 domain-containing protein [Rhodoferax sp.]
MKHLQLLKRLSLSPLRAASLGSSMAASLALVACGGGGGSAPLAPEAVVTSVASAQVLEGAAQASLLEFVVTLNKPVERGLVVTYSTSSVDKPTGYAKGGDACGAGVDFIALSNKSVTIAPGSSTGKLTVTVCTEGLFEPNESLKLSWSSEGAAGGSTEGIIINDDVGGLNGTGSTALLTGLTAFGRDTHALTNASADGALGFSFDKAGTCVVDNVTGLSWQKLPAQNKAYADLAAYVTSVNGLALCGYTDWRVPTANELLNLMDTSKTTGITANADYLGVAADAMAGLFWSSEERAAIGAVDAWMVDADSNGVVSFGNKATARNVRLVRGGHPVNAACDNSDNRFVDHVDGTVSDAHTGLMWKSCPEGYSGNTCNTGTVLSFGSVASVVTQLGKANSAADKGYSDWRVPTRNELASLVNRVCSNPAIVGSVFPATESKPYITSSLSVNAPTTQVWSVDFADGNVGLDLLTRSYYLRLVRAGQ